MVVATAVLFVVICGVAAFTYVISDKNRQAVCNLRTDLEHRVEGSEEFVTEHPDAIKALGFTAAQIEKEITNQHRALSALAVVSCPQD